MKRLLKRQLVWLTVCVCLATTTGSGGCRGDGPASQTNISNSPPDAQTVLLRMRKHYGGLKTAVLSVKWNMFTEANEAKGDKGIERMALRPSTVYYKAPNLYGGSEEQTHKLFPIPKNQLDAYGGFMTNPGISAVFILPQLFLGFQIADIFPQKLYGGQEILDGEKTDKIVLRRDLSASPDPSTSTITLWVNERGQLRKFQSKCYSTVNDPEVPDIHSLATSYVGEITETDNGALPKSFYKKAPPKKPAKAAKPRR